MVVGCRREGEIGQREDCCKISASRTRMSVSRGSLREWLSDIENDSDISQPGEIEFRGADVVESFVVSWYCDPPTFARRYSSPIAIVIVARCDA